ncbi:MAG: formate dehydrogenase [Gemmatimonadetes bacterium]|nr:formate dehydrogenase [Gemmatimonadota bacterium]
MTEHPPMQPGLSAYPPFARWDNWTELESKAWPRREEHRYALVPTTCFNCESACGLLAYVDRDTEEIRKFEGNPLHPASRGRNCAKGPATLNQTQDPERILYPLKRSGERGKGKWERVTWDSALDDIAGRIRTAIIEDRKNEVMYHVGRPGEDGFTERVLAAWGIDGHNSHTNICSSSARAGYAFWMGIDRPSPDYANARVILLISAHLESGHYFNPHAQRIIEGKKSGAKVIVMDPRLSNTATHADHWLPTRPGSEPAVLLAIANQLIQNGTYNRDFLKKWVNWEQFLSVRHPGREPQFEDFEAALKTMYAEYTPEFAAREAGVRAESIVEVARIVAGAGTALAAHNWRAAAAGNLHGWMTTRCLFFLNVLTGSVGTKGGTNPNRTNKFVPKHHTAPAHPDMWNELTWPREYPLAFFEMSFLLPHFLKEGRGTLAMYFTRVYNPVWTNPDGFSWIDMLTDQSKVECHAALTPVWSETAWFADYVLPMGLGGERHDLHSYETHAAQWLGFRQPVLRAYRERTGRPVSDTREVNPGEVWEENEFWIELSWRIDPDGALGIRKHFESPYRPGQKISVDEYYRWIFENAVPGLPEAAAKEGLEPLDYMRRKGSFEVARETYLTHEDLVPEAELQDVAVDALNGTVFTRTPAPPDPNVAPRPAPPADSSGRRHAGVMVDGVVRRGFPTPSGKLEFYSPTLADWGWPDLAVPSYPSSHVAHAKMDLTRGEYCLVPTFRLPVLIHTRSGNAKWLNEIAHSNPLWLHPEDAARIGVTLGELVRVSTEIGHFVVPAWVTEGIQSGVVACSHHMGRWRTSEDEGTDRWSSARVSLERNGSGWMMRREHGVEPWDSTDPDSARVWWHDAGVHQNLTFPVHPDPVSGQHAWHQKVRVEAAHPDDREGDVFADTARAHAVYKEWLAMAKPAPGPGGMRRPHWLLRPLRPTLKAYTIGETP